VTAELSLTDVAGRRLAFETLRADDAGRGNAVLDISSLPSGPFFLRLRSGTQQSVRRIVVTR